MRKMQALICGKARAKRCNKESSRNVSEMSKGRVLVDDGGYPALGPFN